MRKLILALAVCFGAASAYGQVPQQFTVQGVLRNGMGALQSAMVNVTVSFLDSATNGNRIAGPYGPNMVMAVDGLFTLTVADAAIISKLQGKSQVWLQVTVGNDTFDPQIVTAEVYALMCSVADVASSLAPTATIDASKVTGVFTTLSTGHLVGTGGTPTASVGPGAGSGATVTISGTDTAGSIIVSTGSSPISGTVVTITFATPFVSAPHCVVSPNTDFQGAYQTSVAGISSSKFSINVSGATTLPASSAATYSWICIQ